MDELDKIIKDSLNKKPTEKYNKMIKDTMKMIENKKVESVNESKIVDFKPKKKHKMLRFFQSAVAITIVGVLGVTTYAGITRTIKF